jgi:hypothetical protein
MEVMPVVRWILSDNAVGIHLHYTWMHLLANEIKIRSIMSSGAEKRY